MTDTKPTFGVSAFLRGRMAPELPFSHFDGSEAELLALVAEGFDRAEPGYRPGVLLVPVDPSRFYSPVCELREGDKLVGEFKARREGEAPRMSVGVEGGQKTPAAGCSVILYSRETLVESGEDTTGADFDLVMIQARTHEGTEPMKPETLMHNHFGSDGGTATKMSPEEFEAALRESFAYWKGRALMVG